MKKNRLSLIFGFALLYACLLFTAGCNTDPAPENGQAASDAAPGAASEQKQPAPSGPPAASSASAPAPAAPGVAEEGAETAAVPTKAAEDSAPAAPAVEKKTAAPPPVADGSAPSTPPAGVQSVTLMDKDVLQRLKPLLVTFSDPMVPADAVDQPVAANAMPFTLVPAVSGEGRWLTAKSFAFIPDKGYDPGKRYSLLFQENLRSLDGRPVRLYFAFAVEAPKLRGIQAGPFDAGALKQEIYLEFSLPVQAKALAGHVEATDSATGERLRLDIADASATSNEKHRHTASVSLGSYRPRITLTLRRDAPDDPQPMGLQSDIAYELTLPDKGGSSGVPSVSAAADNEGSPISFYEPYCSDSTEGLYARFSLNEDLPEPFQTEFIEVSPDLPFTLEYDNTLIFRDKLESGMRLTVTLKPGLTDRAGRVLKETRRTTVTLPDRDPAISFLEPGNFLTPLAGSRVGVSLVNLDSVTITLRRQYENNLPFMALNPDYRSRNMMREITAREIRIKDAPKNQVQRRAVDVAELAGGRRGIFLLSLSGFREATASSGQFWQQEAYTRTRLVVLTDIGITTRTFPAGITVFATSLATARPLPDAEVKVYSASNQLIARGHTGPDGVFVHKRQEVWDSQLQPSLVTVQHGSENEADISFLPLNGETGIEEPSAGERPYAGSGLEAFVYTPRGVFRPGERVDLKAFVRDAAHEPPAPFPVLFRVLSPDGLEAAGGSASLSDEGGADFSFVLPVSARTGEYTASLEIPGRKNSRLGLCSFKVEEFTPPRLEVALTPRTKRLEAGGAFDLDLAADYLFGAPGAGLRYELGYRATPAPFAPKQYPGYVFGDGERKFETHTDLRFLNGALADSGRATLTFSPPADWRPPALLDILFIAGVQEDGGRWVTRTERLPYYPTPYLLGLKLGQERLVPGRPGVISLAAVNIEGEPAESGPLSVELFRIEGNWHTVQRYDRYVYIWDEHLLPLEKRSLAAKDGRAEFSFTPKSHGRYLVRVANEDGSVVGSRRFEAWAQGEQALPEGNGRMDSVELTLDKPAYRAGETAKLSLKAPFAGVLLLSTEHSTQLETRVLHMDEPSLVLDLPVTEDMDPNIRVNAWVIRPVKGENPEWFAHRAHGSIPLKLSREPHTLTVLASPPERALPNAALNIPFTVTDEQGAPVEGEFSVALIDEGVLSLTAFTTPDPAAYFLAPRRAVSAAFDPFDSLLRPEARATPLLAPGGDASRAYQGSLTTQQVYLTAYLPVVRTDANGQGEAHFTLPEYSGKGRLMIVGAAGNRFASAESPVRVARDIVLEATAPRAVAPGDVFTLPLQFFVLADAAAAFPPAPAPATAQTQDAATPGNAPRTDAIQETAPQEAPATDAEPDAGADSAPDAAPVAASSATEAPAKAFPLSGEPLLVGTGELQDEVIPSAPAASAPSAEPEPRPAEPAIAASIRVEISGPLSIEGDPVLSVPLVRPEKPGAPLVHTLALRAEAQRGSGIAVLTLHVSVPGRPDLDFSKKLEIAVRPPYPRISSVVSALVPAGQSTELAVPGKWMAGATNGNFSLSPSPVLAVLPALEYLREYPYGCLEQLTSRAWPYLTLDAVQRALYSEDDQHNTKAVLAELCARILSMQLPEGGFSVWPGMNEADPWRSIQAIFFLVEAKARTPVRPEALERSLGYLRYILAAPAEALGDNAYAYSCKAHAAFVLTRAGQPPLAWLQHLSGQEGQMTDSGRIFLAGAKALQAGNTAALKGVTAALSAPAASEDKVQPRGNATLESPLRNKGLLLYLWSLLDPADLTTTALCLDVADHLSRSRFFTTQEAGIAALALGAYLQSAGPQGGADYSAELSSPLFPDMQASSGEPVLLNKSPLPLSPEGTVPAIRVAVGKGQAYAVYSVRGLPLTAPAPESSGLQLERVWKDAQGNTLDLASGPVTLRKGDRVFVTLTLSTDRPLRDLVLSDLLPGGMELENPRLNTPAATGDEEDEDQSGPQLHMDAREDRLLLFFDALDGSVNYTYSLRAVSSGVFTLPPLAAEAMYAPEFRAVTRDGKVIVE